MEREREREREVAVVMQERGNLEVSKAHYLGVQPFSFNFAYNLVIIGLRNNRLSPESTIDSLAGKSSLFPSNAPGL